MLELVRGYCAAVLDEAEAAGDLAEVAEGLGALRGLLVSSALLRDVLTDGSISGDARAAVLADLLEDKVLPPVIALAGFSLEYERASEIPSTYENLFELAEGRAASVAGGAVLEGEPPMGRAGAMERIRGFSERVFERLGAQDAVDDVEDELFRFARIAEQQRDLRSALAAPDISVSSRLALLSDLLSRKVRTETLSLIGYAVRAGRARDIVGAVDYLVELAAAERGRRVGEVRAAVELDADERARLVQALSRRTRRTVELRVIIDPSVIGGIGVSVGDTVIDGTVRHRLEQLRESLLQTK